MSDRPKGIDAIQGLRKLFDPTKHTTSPMKGKWETPKYVVREPLHYDLFVTLLGYLEEHAAFSQEQLAQGLGVRTEDIARAQQIYKRSLREHGTICPRCDQYIGPILKRCVTKGCVG